MNVVRRRNSDDTEETDPLGEEEDAMDDTTNPLFSGSLQDLPPVRNHSYLPGTSHPLHHTALLDSSASNLTAGFRISRYSSLPDSKGDTIELAVLELSGVVLFPGSTFPLRFPEESPWRDYLGRQIEACRISPGDSKEVRLGILTAEVPRRTQRLDRRHWARHTFGPTRLRRLSRQLIETLNEREQLHDSDDSEPPQNRRRNMDQAQRPNIENRNPPDLSETTTVELGQRALRRSSADRHGYIGRIGTIVRITYTHGSGLNLAGNGESSGFTFGSARTENGDLVLQSKAISRFRIAGYTGFSDDHELQQQRLRYDPTALVRVFSVEEVEDSRLPLPTIARSCHFNRVPHSLSLVSTIPDFAFSKLLPWKLVSLIKEGMMKRPSLAPFLDSLRHAAITSDSRELPTADDPFYFSFWMASNLPLSQEEKLSLLEMHSTTERLHFIYERVKEEKQTESWICCKVCSMRLSPSDSMFTVGGAEGTTGAYVNMHGIVHQTMTVRDLSEEEVVYLGGRETRDSWFPGYSWTIMSCSVCLHHLGWKFHLVQNALEKRDRPKAFFGLSGDNVKVVDCVARTNNR